MLSILISCITSDSNQADNYNCNDQQCVPSEQYMSYEECQNAINCNKFEDSNFCPPPECNPCPPSRQPNFEVCCAPQYFQQNCEGSREAAPCVTNGDECNPCVPRCDPCEALGPCPMPLEDNCSPRLPCPPLDSSCNPMCSPYRRCRYVQPPRVKSFKPLHTYQPPSIPMANDTCYQKSYDLIDPQTAASCRLPPVRPMGQIGRACGDFARDTVTKVSLKFKRFAIWCSQNFWSQLSFPPLCAERTKPIYPHSRSLLGTGPMQALTTQKHDFVPKFQFKAPAYRPQHNIFRNCGRVENCTVQRLSFLAPCKASRVTSFKPILRYQRPERKFDRLLSLSQQKSFSS